MCIAFWSVVVKVTEWTSRKKAFIYVTGAEDNY
jgi:hypothetical protein